MLHASAEGTKYTEGLIADNKTHGNRLSKLVKLLEVIATGKPTKDAELGNVVKMIGQLKDEHKEMETWAHRFGISYGKGKKRKAAS